MHVTDDLELYAVGALPPDDMQRVGAHLETCAGCRDEAASMATVIAALPEAVQERTPSPELRDRILATARATVVAAVPAAPSPAPAPFAALLRPSWPMVGALAALVLVLSFLSLRAAEDLRAATAERDRYAAVADRMSEGGRWWYMAGTDDLAGSGGTLVVPRKDGRAFVLFHDLKPAPADHTYALWLISPDGRWTRAANFTPDGTQLQTVDLTTQVDGYDRCAVTIEKQKEGRREGPVVMQSRIAPPQQ